MKTIQIGILLAGLLTCGRLMAQSEQLVVPLSEPGKPYKLNVNLISGSIKVTGYEGKSVVIDVQSDGTHKEEHEQKSGMRRISGGGRMNIEASEKNNQVNISTDVFDKPTNLIIKVPQREGSFKLNTVNNGNITVSNVSGELEVINVNGYIHLNGISGSVVANTVNGEVKVSLLSTDPKAAMAFSTLNGNVDVTFPPGIKGNVKLKSDRGNIYSDFDIVTEKRTPTPVKEHKDGMYRISVDDWIYGKIGGGGPELLLKNMNGDIFLRRAK